jgi:hypothetical protein
MIATVYNKSSEEDKKISFDSNEDYLAKLFINNSFIILFLASRKMWQEKNMKNGIKNPWMKKVLWIIKTSYICITYNMAITKNH